MTDIAMFPLGSVLFPYMPIQLRVFEDRYLVMLAHILQTEPSEFGVVLIERGQEVGGGEIGGEKRFSFGTVAQIQQLQTGDGMVGLVAAGERRIEVIEWMAEDPYPQAVIRELDELEWSDELQPLRDRAESVVRRALAVATEFGETQWSATVELSDEPLASTWQLAAIAPLGPLDQLALLRSTSTEQLLSTLIELTLEAEETLRQG